jgi:mRNA capping enzyme, beta chain
MNNFLNEAVKASMPQAGLNRIPLSYAHKKERDTFYEVPPSEIPPRIQNYLNPRHKPKVRVTTDQRNGEVLAKIIKCRIADLDVYSPRTNVDWRISVNLEMNFDRDVRQFPISDGGARGRTGGERIKDRMSYRHLAYQIDLTQVGSAEVSCMYIEYTSKHID